VIARLDKGTDEMKRIFEEVEEGLTGFDFEREIREYTPHITLGRMRTPAAFPDGDLPPLERMEFPVDGLVLFKSTLTPAGAIYSPIWKIKLGGDNDEGRTE
jgi:2'-5' RNA ligase